ncbi:hypothetical protein GCM10029978_095520 [Actinoallomurus acanthiterrae]
MTSRVLVRARLGTVLTFALAGMLCGVWVSRTPALADKFGMREGDVGVAILVWGIGAIIAMQGLRGVMARLGGAAVLKVAAPLTAVSLALVGLAPTKALLFVAVALFGMAFGLTDIGMNAQASAVERSYKRPIMNGMHAGWCAGGISGGLIGSLSASAGLSFAETLVGGAILALPLTIVLGRTYIPDTAAAAGGKGRARLPLVVYLIGVLAFVAFMMEGTIADWSGLYLNRELGATQSVAALAYPLFEAAMLAGAGRRPGPRPAGHPADADVRGSGHGGRHHGRGPGPGDAGRARRLRAGRAGGLHRDPDDDLGGRLGGARPVRRGGRAGRRDGLRRAGARPGGDRVPRRRGVAAGRAEPGDRPRPVHRGQRPLRADPPSLRGGGGARRGARARTARRLIH